MSFRHAAHQQLLANRNDLIFIKDNLLIPEDLDRGPTEDMIKVDDIIIPPWLRVCEIPTNVSGVSDQRKEFLDVIDECTKLIDATYPLVKAEGPFSFSDSAIDLNATNLYLDYLKKTYEVLARAYALIPVNYNMYLTRLAAHVNLLAGKIEPLMEDIYMLQSSDDAMKIVASSDEYASDTFVDSIGWGAKCAHVMINGLLCGDFETEILPLIKESADFISKVITILGKFSGGTYNYDDFLKHALDVRSDILRVTTTDYHLERSKAPLISFNKTSIDDGGYIPSMHYDYVHCRYYVSDDDDDIEYLEDHSSHIFEHDHEHMIGDIVV